MENNIELRKCGACGVTRPVTDFIGTKIATVKYCITCRNKKSARYLNLKETNPDKIKQQYTNSKNKIKAMDTGAFNATNAENVRRHRAIKKAAEIL